MGTVAATSDQSWVPQALAICDHHGVALYDFEPKHSYIAPTPAPLGGFLTSFVVAIYKADLGHIRALAINVRDAKTQTILDMLQEAIPHFDEQAQVVDEGASMPVYTRRNGPRTRS